MIEQKETLKEPVNYNQKEKANDLSQEVSV